MDVGNSEAAQRESPQSKLDLNTVGPSRGWRDRVFIHEIGFHPDAQCDPWCVARSLKPGWVLEYKVYFDVKTNLRGFGEGTVKIHPSIGLPCDPDAEVTCANNTARDETTVNVIFVTEKKSSLLWCKPRQKPTPAKPCRTGTK